MEKLPILKKTENSQVKVLTPHDAINIEGKLTPELLEKIMSKVQDINEKNLAYTVLGDPNADGTESISIDKALNSSFGEEPSVLEKILDDGLLGGKYLSSDKNIDRKKWAEGVRNKPKKETRIIHFNITGRSYPKGVGRAVGRPIFHITDSFYVHGGNDKIVFLFNHNSFREVNPRDLDKDYPGLKNRTYFATQEPGYFKRLEKMGPYRSTGENPPQELGFQLTSRIAPRFFKGIIISTDVEKIVSLMKKVYKDKMELCIPVYDFSGNLLWPKQMNYAQVKKLVEEKRR